MYRFIPEATRKSAAARLRQKKQAGAFIVRARSDNAKAHVLTMLQPDEAGHLVTEHVQIRSNATTGDFSLAGVRQSAETKVRYGSLVALIEHLQTEGVLASLGLPQGMRGAAPMHALVDIFAGTDARKQTLQVRQSHLAALRPSLSPDLQVTDLACFFFFFFFFFFSYILTILAYFQNTNMPAHTCIIMKNYSIYNVYLYSPA